MVKIEDFDHITCYTIRYSSGDRGIRTIYNTKIPLWEECLEYGNPIFAQISEPLYTVFPKDLPITLPKGAISMMDDVDYFGKFIDFGNNCLDAFIFAET